MIRKGISRLIGNRGLLIILLLILALPLSFATDISDCSSTYTISSPGTYDVINDLPTSVTCIDVQSNDVVIDCHGYQLSELAADNGISVSGYSNILIKNCNFLGFSAAIVTSSAQNITIIDSNFFSNTYAIFFDFPNYVTISGVNIDGGSYGILMYSGNNTLIENSRIINTVNYAIHNSDDWSVPVYNTIINNNTLINFTHGIYLDYQWGNKLYNTTILDNYLYGTAFGNGIYANGLEDAVIRRNQLLNNNNAFQGNHINNLQFSDSNLSDNAAQGFYLYYGDNLNFSNNFISDSGNGEDSSLAIYFSNHSTVYNNTIIRDPGQALYLYSLDDLLIDNIRIDSATLYSIYAYSVTNTEINNAVISNSNYGVYFPYDSNKVTITNINVTDCIYGLEGYFGHNFTLDGAYIKSDGSGDYGVGYWWGDDAVIKNVYIEGFRTNNGIGLYLYPDGISYNLLVENVTLNDNLVGIYINSLSDSTIFNAKLINNSDDGIQMWNPSSDIYINNTYIEGSSDGIDTNVNSFHLYNSTITRGPDAWSAGLYLSGGPYYASNLFNQNTITDYLKIIDYSSAATIYVDLSVVLPRGNYILSDDSQYNGAFYFTNNDVTLDCNGSNIDGVTRTGTSGYGIFSSELTNTEVKNCHIYNYYYGIYDDGNADFKVNGNNISENFGLGIYSVWSTNPNISNNFFSDNQGDDGASIQTVFVNGAIIKNNTILRDAYDSIYFYRPYNFEVDSNIISGSVNGIRSYGDMENLRITNSKISEMTNYGIYLNDNGDIDESHNIQILNNNITNTGNAIYRDYTGMTIDGLEILGNRVETSSSVCVYLGYVNNLTMNNNFVRDCSNDGVRLNEISNMSLENLTISSTSYDALQANPIYSSTFKNMNFTDFGGDWFDLECHDCYLTNIFGTDTRTSRTYLFDLYSSTNLTINNSAVRSTQASDLDDIYFWPSDESQCSLFFENFTGKTGKQIKFLSTESTIQNEELSQLILCNASNSIIQNVSSESRTQGFYSNNLSLSDTLSKGFSLYTHNSTLNNITSLLSLAEGLYLGGDGNFLTNSTIKYSNSGNYGLYLDGNNNVAYNNILKNYNNFVSYSANFLNGSNVTGTNIVGGSLLGGNVWLNTTDNGYSITCTDADVNGICDDAYDVMGDASNMDYYPLKYTLTPAPGNNCSYCNDCRAKMEAASPGDTIYLTENIYDYNGYCISPEMSNDVGLDCQGHIIDGVGSYDAIQIGSLSGTNISNCDLREFGQGIYAPSITNAIIDNMNISSMATSGIYLIQGETENITIKNSNIQDSGSYGIYIDDWGNLDEIRGINIINNTLTNNPFGIYRALDTYPAYDINITGNTISGSSIDGIYALASHKMLIDSNQIQNCSGDGIRISDSENGTIKDARIVNISSVGGDDAGGNGIYFGYILTPSKNFNLTNITVISFGDNGIQGYVDGLLIVDSVLSSNVVGNMRGIGIWYNGSNYLVQNTIITSSARGIRFRDDISNTIYNVSIINTTIIGMEEYGLQLEYVNNAIIAGLNSSDNNQGIELNSVNNITIYDSELSNNTYGFYNYDFTNLVAYNNLIKNNTYAIYDDSLSNTYDAAIFTDNTYSQNGYVFFDPSYAQIYVNNPTTLPQGNYYLSDDYWMGAFIINTNDMIFDCADSSLEGNSQVGYGIWNTQYSDVTIKNCNFSNFNSGLYFGGEIDNSSFENIVSNNNNVGLNIDCSYCTNVSLKNIDTSFNSEAGMYLGNMVSVWINNWTSRWNTWRAIDFWSMNNVTITNAYYDNNVYGLYFDGQVYNSTFENVTVSNSSDTAIWMDDWDSSDNLFRKIDLYSNSNDVYFNLNSGVIQCNYQFINVTLSSGKLYGFFSSSVLLSNFDYGKLFFCNADYSLISNLSASQELTMYYTDFSNFSNLNFSDKSGVGFDVRYSTNNTFTNLTGSRNGDSGMRVDYSSDNLIQSSVFDSNIYAGLLLAYFDGNTIKNSYLRNNSAYGIQFDESGSSERNSIYNSFFNQTTNLYFTSNYRQNWNSSYQAGTSIVGGPTLGGNFWAKPNGRGFSQLCGDEDSDGICDQTYGINWLNKDYFPLSAVSGQALHSNITSCGEIIIPGMYNLTQDIIDSPTSNCIDIQANNVMLDCQGHTIDGDDSASNGIYIYRESSEDTNVTIINCVVSDFANGNIYFENADGNTIENVTVLSSPNNGLYVSYSSNNTIEDVNASSNNERGIYFIGSSQNNLTNIIASNTQTYYAINLQGSSDNIIYNVTAESNAQHGLLLMQSSNNNQISYFNSLNNGLYGVSIEGNANNNTFSNITSTGNSDYGFFIWESSMNTITDSYIGENTNYGVYLTDAGVEGNNLIYNNLFNNTFNVYFDGTTYSNDWNTSNTAGTNIIGGSEMGGNFWAKPNNRGFSQVCADLDSNGFCDQTYTMNSLNKDYFVLTDRLGLPYNGDLSVCDALDVPTEYHLTADIIDSSISNCIDIQSNNVILDCQGHTIDGDDAATNGINLYRSSIEDTNVTIKNCVVLDWANANMYVENANENMIDNVTVISSPNVGIYIYSSSNNNLSNIIATANSVYGISLYSSSYNSVSDIIVSQSSFGIYFMGLTNSEFSDVNASGNAHGLYGSGSNHSFSRIIINENSQYGLFMSSISNSSLLDIIANSNERGISMSGSSDNSIVNLTANNNSYGVLMESSSNNNLLSDIVANANSAMGIALFTTSNYNRLNNIVASSNAVDGLYLSSSNYNDLSNITANLNSQDGIYFTSSSFNIILNATLSSNTNGVTLASSNNNTLTSITAEYNVGGIFVQQYSRENKIYNSTTRFNSYAGMYINYDTELNYIFGLISTENQNGITISSSESTIRNSRIENNSMYGLYLANAGLSGPNMIYNNFFNNTITYYQGGSTNLGYWNNTYSLGTNIINGPYLGGNFWTNPTGNGFSDLCADDDGDGICDAAYTIETDNIDNYPLSEFIVLTVDNSSSPRDWVIDANTSILITATTRIGTINTTHYCVYAAGTTPCTEFTSVESNETVVDVGCQENSACEWIVRHYARNDVPKQGPIHESNPIQIVYGSYVNDTAAINTNIQDNSTITGSDLFNSNISASQLSNSQLNNSVVSNSIITDSQMCGNGDDLVIRGSVLLSGVILSGGYTYYVPTNTSRVCYGMTPSKGELISNDTVITNTSLIKLTYSGSIGSTVTVNLSSIDINQDVVELTDDNNDGLYEAVVQMSGNNTISDVWKNLTPSNVPIQRGYALMAYDSDNDAVVMIGGFNGGSHMDDTWIYDSYNNTWTSIPTDMAEGIFITQMVYDKKDKVFIAYGGATPSESSHSSKTWQFNLSSRKWTILSDAGNDVRSPSLTYDERMAKVMWHGGNQFMSYFGSIYAYDYSSNTWSSLITPSEGGTEKAFAYDSINNVSLIFGGYNFYATPKYYNSTIIYDSLLNQLTTMNVAQSPAARMSHRMIFDKSSARFILFGGAGEGGVYFDDTWAYDYALNEWINITISGPSARFAHQMAYDSINKQTILFGGLTTAGYQNDTWAFYSRYPSESKKHLKATINDNLGNTLYANVDITLDYTPPTGSISINDGDAQTSSRSVILNMQYADENGIESCRFANEQTITSQWEACTPTKSWLLTEGLGTKTVFAEIKDAAGNILLVNDTIDEVAGGDVSPPVFEYVLDGLQSQDIDFFSSNTTLSAHWSAIDYESYYVFYKYRILADEEPLGKEINPALQDNLVGLYHFNNNVSDFSGNNNDGNAYGSINCSVSGKMNGACRFNGADTRIDLDMPSSIFNAINYSIELWFKSTQNADNIALVTTRNPSGTDNGFALHLHQGRISYYTIDGAGSGTNLVNAEVQEQYDDGTWHHVVVTTDRTAGNNSIYVDGVFKASATGDISYAFSGQNIELGAMYGNTYYYNGLMDEVAFYDRKLSGAEIAAKYQEEKGEFIDVAQAKSIMVKNLTLFSDTNYSFEIIAYNIYNITSNMTSDGAVLNQGNPIINDLSSSTHPLETTSYANRTAIFEWNATDDSGKIGYSYSLDQNPYTQPDSILESAINMNSTNSIIYNLDAALQSAIISSSHASDNKWYDSNGIVTPGGALYSWSTESIEGYLDLADLDPSVDYNLSIFGVAGFIDYADMAWKVDGGNYADFYLRLNAWEWYNLGIARGGSRIYLKTPGSQWGARDRVIQYLRATPLVPSSNNTATFNDLNPGTYYFHLKALDEAGNYAVSHRKIIVGSSGTIIILNQLPESTTASSINLTGLTNDYADLKLYLNNANILNKTANGTFSEIINLTNGTNNLFATAQKDGFIITSNWIAIKKLNLQLANMSFTMSFNNAGTALSKTAYYDTGDYLFGLASDSGIASPIASPLSVSTNESGSAYIFMAKEGTKIESKNSLLEDDEFMDSTSPSFGVIDSKYVIGAYLNYDTMIFIGNISFETGRYYISIQNKGLNADKKRVFLVKKA